MGTMVAMGPLGAHGPMGPSAAAIMNVIDFVLFSLMFNTMPDMSRLLRGFHPLDPTVNTGRINYDPVLREGAWGSIDKYVVVPVYIYI